jgi:glutaredoxin
VLHRLDYLEHGSRLGTDGLVLFTGSRCPFSAKLRADLDRLGVGYEDRVIDRDSEALHQLVRLAGDAGVPVAVRGGEMWNGWSEGRAREIRDALAR